jgi:hypothetical protein
MILARELLYDLLWKRSVDEVSRIVGMSNRGLGKLCKRQAIPVPGRGYWARLQVGQSVYRPPLEPLVGAPPIVVDLDSEAQKKLAEVAALEARGWATKPPDERAFSKVPSLRTQDSADGLRQPLAVQGGEKVPAEGRKPRGRSVAHTAQADAAEPASNRYSASITEEKKRPLAAIHAGGRKVAGVPNLSADLAYLVELALAAAQFRQTEEFIVQLEHLANELEPSAAHVLALRLERARNNMARVSPFGRVVDECREVALGRAAPRW